MERESRTMDRKQANRSYFLLHGMQSFRILHYLINYTVCLSHFMYTLFLFLLNNRITLFNYFYLI